MQNSDRTSESDWAWLHALVVRACATLIFFAIGAPAVALADVVSCVDAHASGQREANAGHLKAALERFAACGSNTDCPAEIRDDCVAFFARVENSMPTVIFVARDGTGADVADVRVYVAGELVADGLTGRARKLDPGRYRVKFAFLGGRDVEVEILVHEGEKNRMIAVRAPALVATGTPAEPGQSARPLPASFWLAAGVGAAGLTSWGVFGLLGRELQSDLEACAPSCPARKRDDFDAMRRDYLIADISLGLGLVSGGVATVIYLSRRAPVSPREEPRSSRLSLTPSLSPKSAGLVLHGSLF